MKVFPTSVAAAALAATIAVSTSKMTLAQDGVVPAVVGTPEFEKYRPVFHFQERENWMNDPCAPYYDEETGLFHLFYQLNPNSTSWGNMTWGHAVSDDQVTWSDYPNALRPFEDEWDYLGVFSGFAMPKAIGGKDTVFYTGVTKLPISWKLEYLFGEHVVYATTEDNGKTWQKGDKPLVELPPSGLNVTGWRDPNVFHSTALDTHYGYANADGNSSNWLLVAGGIHDVGPRIFLYHSNDYLDWDYKGYLLSKEKNTTFSEYSGSWGFNFETSIYVEIEDDEGETHNTMLFAAEGDPRRYPMWATGTIGSGAGCGVDVDEDAGLFNPLMVGITDRSDWYANSIYTDPKTGKHVLIGWITDNTGFSDGQPQGWDGILSIQREVGISIIKDIADTEDHLVGQGDWIVARTSDLTCADGSKQTSKTIKTLGLEPLRNFDSMRGDTVETVAEAELGNSSASAGDYNVQVLNSTGKSFELYAEVADFERGSRVGFQVRRSSEGDELTTVVYDDAEKKVIIDRSASSSADCEPFTTFDVVPGNTETWGNFYLYDLFNGNQCETTREKLVFRVFVDVSSVEVFVNGRFTLSSRIYPCESVTSSDGIALVSSGAATFSNVSVWTNPKHAWAEDRVVPTF